MKVNKEDLKMWIYSLICAVGGMVIIIIMMLMLAGKI